MRPGRQPLGVEGWPHGVGGGGDDVRAAHDLLGTLAGNHLEVVAGAGGSHKGAPVLRRGAIDAHPSQWSDIGDGIQVCLGHAARPEQCQVGCIGPGENVNSNGRRSSDPDVLEVAVLEDGQGAPSDTLNNRMRPQ